MNRLLLRFILGMIFVLLTSTMVVRWGARHGTDHQLRTGKFSDLMASMDVARRRLEEVPEEQAPGVLNQLGRELSTPVRLTAIDDPEIPPAALSRLRRGRLYMIFEQGQGRTIFLPLRGARRVLIMGPLEPLFHRRDFPTGIVLGAILLIILLTGLELALPIVRRLRRLEQAATQISEGNIEARAEDTAKDAIGSLARRFNLMADRVQELLENQQQLIQAVAHELRTPLARVRFGLEMLASAETEDERAQREASLDDDLTELDELVEELLLYIRAGEEALNLQLQPLAVQDELTRVVNRAGELRPGIDVRIEDQEASEPAIHADARAFRRAIQNLLANAVRVARERVTVQVARDPNTLSIMISDDGPGIPPEDRQRIFEPFTRLDQSRTRDSGGSGLGLAIVRRIIEAHGGTITVEAAPGGGALFITTWRTTPASPARTNPAPPRDPRRPSPRGPRDTNRYETRPKAS